MTRVALGIAYRGSGYNGWQSQSDGRTVQDALERALAQFLAAPVRTHCAGRTDAGVHALNQVVHLDSEAWREPFRGCGAPTATCPRTSRCSGRVPSPVDFHARNHARGRRYAYVLRESVARPALEVGLAGWVFRPLDADAMRAAAAQLIGTHDFSAFRSSECQAASPVKELRAVTITRRGAYWRFDFDGSAFLHHMIRNIMGCLIAIGQGQHPPGWISEVMASRSRDAAAPTFSAAGLYFLGPYYDAGLGIAEHTPAFDWLPA